MDVPDVAIAFRDRQTGEFLAAIGGEQAQFDPFGMGREDGEVLGLLREGLEGAARTTHIQDIQGEFNAIDVALE